MMKTIQSGVGMLAGAPKATHTISTWDSTRTARQDLEEDPCPCPAGDWGGVVEVRRQQRKMSWASGGQVTCASRMNLEIAGKPPMGTPARSSGSFSQKPPVKVRTLW
jgi:hypothetical protein